MFIRVLKLKYLMYIILFIPMMPELKLYYLQNFFQVICISYETIERSRRIEADEDDESFDFFYKKKGKKTLEHMLIKIFFLKNQFYFNLIMNKI